MSDIDKRYSIVDENDPFVLSTKAGTFGGPDDAEDNGQFAFGGGSTVDGTENTENYAALPSEWYQSGLVKPGQSFRVVNPDNGKSVDVVARDKGPSFRWRGLDIAPHAMKELGAKTDQNLHIDLHPALTPAVNRSLPSEDNLTPIGEKPERTQGPNIASRNPDGSVTFQDGVTAYNDGHIEYDMNGERYSETSDGKRYRKAPKTQIKDLVDATTGMPYSAVVNTQTGEIVKKIEDPSSRAYTQHAMIRARIQQLTKSQPGVADYITTKNNYDSIAQNALIPEDKRTPADDNTAIQAFGMIEHPRSSVTDMDKKMGTSMVPVWSKMGLKWHNLTRNDARILDQNTVQEMAEAGRRGFESRKKTYYEQIMPMVKDALAVGLDPNEIIGANVWPDPYIKGTGASPTPTSSVTPQTQQNGDQAAMDFVKQYSDPKDPMFAKAQEIAKVLKSRNIEIK